MNTQVYSVAKLRSKDAIVRLQAAMSKMPQVQLETKHFFADGMYCRWVFRPKGTLIVGKVHKREHFYMVLSGKVEVAGGSGAAVRLKAPAVIVSSPGTKRAVFAIKDSVCVTVHRTAETDIEKIETELVEDDPDAMFDSLNMQKSKTIEHSS